MKKIEKIQKNGEAVNALKLDFYTKQSVVIIIICITTGH